MSADVSIANSIEMLLSGNEEVTTRRTFISFRIDLDMNTAIQLAMAASNLAEMSEFANIIPGSIGLRVFNTSSEDVSLSLSLSLSLITDKSSHILHRFLSMSSS